MDKLISKSRLYVSVLAVVYVLLALVSSMILVSMDPTLDPGKQYVYTILAAGLFGVLWVILADIGVASYSYAQKIKGSKEAPAFLAIANSVVVLFASLVIIAFMNLLKIDPASNVYKILTVSIYYTSAVLAVVFFLLIGKAGNIFATYVKKQKSFVISLVLILLGFGAFCLYAWLTISKNPEISSSPSHILNFVSSNVFLISIYVPLIISWVYGLTGAFGFYLYQRNVSGVIYKRSLIWLTGGFIAIVAASASRQISNFLTGLTGLESLTTDFGRVLIMFIFGIVALLVVRHGVILLDKIERDPSKTNN